MNNAKLQVFGHEGMALVVAGLLMACSHPASAQAPNAAINGSPVSFFSYQGRFDTSFEGTDQIYRNDAGLTLFLNNTGYGFTGNATQGSTGGGGNWSHLGTVQLTPNSYRDELQIITPQGPVNIAQLVSYFPGSSSINIATTITNNSSATYNTARLIYGADTFINGNDSNDFGVEDFIATRSIGTQDNLPAPLFSGLSGFQSIGDPGISSMNYFAGFYGTLWNTIRAGSLPNTIDGSPGTRDQGIALSFDRATSLAPGQTWTVRLQWIYELPGNIFLSSCNVTSPAPNSSHAGPFGIVFDGNNNFANPVNSIFEYSTNGGQTWNSCSAATSSSLSNPDVARGTPFIGATFTWDPVADGVGINDPQVVDLRVSVVDSGGGQTAECIVNNLTIERAAPQLQPIGTLLVDELAELSFTAMADPGLIPSLTFSLANGTAGSVPSGASITSGGAFTWTPSEAQGPGSYTFDVRVSDGTFSDSETITVNVSEVNRPPVLANIGTLAVDEQVALTFTATATDPDTPPATLSFSLANGTAGSVPSGASITSGGSFTWTPSEAQGPGSYTFDVRVSDGTFSDSETITVNVSEVNRPPVLANIGTLAVDEQVALTFTATATDPDTPPATLSFSLANGTAGSVPSGALITSGGAFTWTPTEAQGPGSYTFDVRVSDGTFSDSETITVNVSEVNRPPVLATIGTLAVDEQVALTFTATATDPDTPPATLSFSLANGTAGAVPSGAFITTAGAFTWTPTEAQGPGSYTFDVRVSDGTLTDFETITVSVAEVNRPPVLANIGTLAVDEQVPLTFTATATDPDTPPATLSFSLANGTAGAVPSGASITSGGVFTWTPTEAQGPGSYTFDVRVSDGTLTDFETVTVSVAEVNRPPVLATIGTLAIDEQVALTFTATATDPDTPPATLSFSLANGTAGAVPSGASITTGGAFTWTPSEAQGPGSYTFDVRVSDGTLTDFETITVSVAEVNRPPVLATIGTLAVDEQVALTFTATATDPDTPPATLSFSLANGTSGAVPSGASITSGGAFTWTPSEAQGPGSYTFDVRVSDGTLTDFETVTVSVAEVNRPPVLATIGTLAVDEQVALTFTATATDPDTPPATLSFSLANGTSGAVPSGASITTAGAFTWTPSEAQGPGSYTFDVRVSDGTLTDFETVTVSVAEVNRPPVLATIGTLAVDEQVALTFTATASDPDTPPATLSFSLANGTAGSIPSGASITSAGVFTWTPSEAQGPGSYTFDVRVSDGTLTDFETVTVSVAEVNRPPVLATIGTLAVDEQVALTFTATATDPDTPPATLSFSLANGTAGAVPSGALITTAGAFTWTPSEAQGPGSYTFDVRVSDGTLTDFETITVSVAEVNRPPVLATIGTLAVDEQVALTFTATATDPDTPPATLSFSLANGTAGAVPSGASITTGGAFTWTPTEAQGPGSYTFDVRVSDGTLTDFETITVSVAEVNRPPVLATIGTLAVDEQVALTFTATATDPDNPPASLSFSLVNGTAGSVPSGALITSGGAFTWTPTEAQGPGSYTFDVRVSDGTLTDSETIVVSVNNVLDQTATAISSSANPSVFGQAVVITTTVSPPAGDLRTPTGTVQLRDGAALLDTKTLVNGQASFTLSSLSVALHQLTASYLGDSEFQAGISPTFTQDVRRSGSQIGLATSVSPSAFGQQVTFTATVAATLPGAGIPSGNVSYIIDGTPAGTRSLVSGVASLAVSNLAVGNHTVTVEYAGSGNFLASTSGTLNQVVGKAVSRTVVTSTNNPSRLGESVTFTATVSVDPPGQGTPTGTVEFLDGTLSLGVFPLGTDGKAAVSLNTLAIGNHPITARYSGDASFAGHLSALLDQSVRTPKYTITGLAATQVEGTAPTTGPITLTFTVSKNETTAGAESIGYSIAGSGTNPADVGNDFAGPPPVGFPSGTLAFGTAIGSQVLSIRVLADDLYEANETFKVTLANFTTPSLALTTASGTILNDDTLRLSIVADEAIAEEAAGSDPGVLTVSRNGTFGSSSFGLQLAPASTATYPADFTLGNAAAGGGGFTVTIPAGSSSITIPLTPADDVAAEASEFATLLLTPSAAYEISGGGSASITIPANDLAVTILADFNPLSSPNGGAGTLRQAILNANLFPGPDVITIGQGVSGTLFTTQGELRITSDVSVVGPGADFLTISGDLDQSGSPTPGDTRVIRVDDGNPATVIDVALSGLTLTRGRALGTVYPDNAGGGVLNSGELLFLDRVKLTNHTANFGAAIESTGSLIVSRSTISDNDALELGGGIDNFAGDLEVSDSTISDNSAGFGGGGIENSGDALIHGCTLVRNSALKLAGAIDSFGGNLEITNSTVSANQSEIGGGLVHENGLMTIVNCTVVNNTALLPLNANVGGGIFVTDTSTSLVRLSNSIFAGNVRIRNGASIPSDLGGRAVLPQSSNNLIGDASSNGGLSNGQQGNLIGNGGSGVRPLSTIVAALASNGGPTQTHALVPNSPAINAGNNSLAILSGSIPLTFDQRGTGFLRIASATVDIGAYERNPDQPRITSISRDPATGVELTWISEPGVDYEVLRSTDLTDWTVISPSLRATSGFTQWTDPAPTPPKAFYFVRRR